MQAFNNPDDVSKNNYGFFLRKFLLLNHIMLKIDEIDVVITEAVRY